MSFTVTVTPNETFPDGSGVTRAMLRNAASPGVSIGGGAGDANIANDASIHPKKLAAVTEGQILVGSATAHDSGSNKQLAAVLPSSGASITAAGVITPSDGKVTHAKLAATNDNDNVIKGANSGTSITSAASGDLILVADSNDSYSLQSITLGNLCNTGTVNVITPAASFDMDVNFPVNSFAIAANSTLTPTGHPASGEYQTSILYITNGSGSDRTLTLAAGSGSEIWSVLKYSSATPTFTIPDGESAVLSVMAFNGSQIGAFAATA